jgi:signal transduction histidine kinase/DNA-binding response OmpR family regulator
MLGSLHWRTALGAAEARAQLHELRRDTLRLFLGLTTAGYLVWHYVNALTWPAEQMTRVYAIAPAAAAVLGGTFLLLRRGRRAATALFVGGTLLALTWAVLVLENGRVAMLYPTLALVAAFVIHPLGGFAVVGAAAALLAAVGAVRPGLVESGDVWQTVAFGGAAVGGAWTLMHHLFTTLRWYAEAFAEAERHAREAREHRGQLVRACRQLDAAYRRLERANGALRYAWRAADEAERSKMELAVNISHELRTPLNLVVGYSEMMLTSPGSYGGVTLPAPYRADMGALHRSAQHLLSLTDDILDLGKMEVGRLGLHRAPSDLAELLRDAAALVRDYVEAKGLELRLALPDAAVPVVLDRLRVRQVLLNLLTNAARCTARGHVEVELVLRERDVRVVVRDTGPGIPPDVLPRLFERHAAADRSGADGPAGSGLGLPISRRLVELHGGEMGATNRPGAGSELWFTLPRDPTADAAVPPPAYTAVPPHGATPARLVVLAHADAALGRLLQRHLEGFEVELAGDLAGALARAAELSATAVVADLDAPPEPPGAAVPVVRCPLPRTDRLVARLGAADYLLKPVSPARLHRALRALDGPVGRILVVDDDPRFVRFLTRVLETAGAGYAVTTAHNGDEALEKMRAERPDVVLLDMVMPGLDGGEVLGRMAAEPALAGVKVVVLSAHQEGEGMVPLGTDFRISKPEGFYLAELTGTIGAALSALAPLRAELGGAAPASGRAPPGSPASAGTPPRPAPGPRAARTAPSRRPPGSRASPAGP